jgi:glycosyltransferase involved in cell wall biosynthesis
VKVAFVLGTSSGGTGAHVRMLAAGCAAGGIPACVFGPAQTNRDFAFTGSADPASADPASAARSVTFVPVEIADRPRARYDMRAIIRLRRLLRSTAPDVVHAHGMRAGALTALALVGTRSRCPLVVTVHNAPVAGGAVGAIYRALELIVARRADSVLCVSADLEERMRAAGARRVAAAVVPPPAITFDISAETSNAIAPGLPVVLAVGRLAPQKGFGVLIEAAARWRDIQPAPRLVIVGDGPLDAELKAQATSLGVLVEFAGRRSDVPALLAAADVFVLPSLWEGQALILQEALRAGVPIVATRTGGNPALTGEDAALLVPPGDAAQLAGAVRAVLADPALASRLGKAALDRAGHLPDEADAVSAALAEYRHLVT